MKFDWKELPHSTISQWFSAKIEIPEIGFQVEVQKSPSATDSTWWFWMMSSAEPHQLGTRICLRSGWSRDCRLDEAINDALKTVVLDFTE